jgi:hypothetical protein
MFGSAFSGGLAIRKTLAENSPFGSRILRNVARQGSKFREKTTHKIIGDVLRQPMEKTSLLPARRKPSVNPWSYSTRAPL